MKIFIAYGWPEGKWHSKYLETALKGEGYKITNSQEDADVIIAHSAGCYMLHPGSRTKLILLIGLPNWPNRAVYRSTMQKVSLETKDKYWLTKTLFHILYALRLTSTLKTWQAFHRKLLPQTKSRVVLVRNLHDTYMNDAVTKKLAKDKGWAYENLEGQHDDLWQNPLPYTSIIRQETS